MPTLTRLAHSTGAHHGDLDQAAPRGSRAAVRGAARSGVLRDGAHILNETHRRCPGAAPRGTRVNRSEVCGWVEAQSGEDGGRLRAGNGSRVPSALFCPRWATPPVTSDQSRGSLSEATPLNHAPGACRAGWGKGATCARCTHPHPAACSRGTDCDCGCSLEGTWSVAGRAARLVGGQGRLVCRPIGIPGNSALAQDPHSLYFLLFSASPNPSRLALPTLMACRI